MPDIDMAYMRRMRDQLLKDSDWALMPDSPLSEEQKEKWKEYRQALRNIPQQCIDTDGQPSWPHIPLE